VLTGFIRSLRYAGLTAVTLGAAATSASAAERLGFNEHVRPILSDKCFHCHGNDVATQEADLRLDLREAAIEAGAIVPGDSGASEMITRIHDSEDPMPPTKSKISLTDAERKTLTRWIDEGAEYELHWAFVPLPAETTVPDKADLGELADWVANPIDHFVAARLISAGLKPTPEAAPYRLHRRASFDLTGLPPTEPDAAPLSYPEMIDSLLATSAYGERMTNEWLDVARYADTFGFQTDSDRPVWPWRDWVIRAFNENLSYDQFLTWQLAGDLLPNPTHDQMLATTFGRLHQQKTEGGSVEEEFRIEYVADRTHTFGTAFLGLTLECARCHDHKYDPISQREYYQFTAYFNSIDEAGLYPFGMVQDRQSMPTPTLDLTSAEQDAKTADLRVAEVTALNARDAIDPAEAFSEWKTNTKGALEIPEFSKLVDCKAAATVRDGKLINLLTDKPIGLARNTIPEGADHVVLTGDDTIALPTDPIDRHQPFTAHLEIKPTQRHDRAVLFHRTWFWTDSASRGYEITILDGRINWSLIHFWPGNAASIRMTSEIPINQWSNVTVTSDGSSKAGGLAIYIDGKKAKTEVVRDSLTKSLVYNKAPKTSIIGARGRDTGFPKGQLRRAAVYMRELSAPEISAVAGTSTQIAPDDATGLLAYYLSAQSPKFRSAQADLNTARAALSKQLDSIKQIMVMRETPEPRPTHILGAGSYENPLEEVQRQSLAVLPPFADDLPQDRLGLSKWLTSPDHPLTARVTVNRYWQMFFGTGLVATSEDFGSQGSAPTHPELLDWLARDFINSGWDVKHLCKLITTSATYRQDSNAPAELLAEDPQNAHLARGPSHRLTGEMIRDSALAASGLLANRIGGPPAKPYDLSQSFKPMKHDSGEGLYRRSLYTYWKRTAPAPVMMAFDAVKRDVCMVRREPTATPLQALVLLNGPQFVEAARALAEGVLATDQNAIETAIDNAFWKLTSRPPTDQERQILAKLWQIQSEHFAAHPKETAKFLGTGQRKPNAALPPHQLAAATVVIQAIMNLDESVMKR